LSISFDDVDILPEELMDHHSYNEVLDYLKRFFETRVESSLYLEELKN